MNSERKGLEVRLIAENGNYHSIKRRTSTLLRHPDAMSLLLGIAVGLGVCAPLLNGNRLFLLDWSVGPHVVIATPAAVGLNGGLTAGIGASTAVALLNRFVAGASTWLPLFAFFPVAAVGAGRLAGGSRWSRVAAGTLYAVNPFVFNRLYVGHIALLIGYALLPFAIKTAIRSLSSQSPSVRWFGPSLWWAGLTSLSPHFAWIYGLVVLGVAIVAIFKMRYPFRRVAIWFATSMVTFSLMSTYLLLQVGSTNLPTRVGSVSLNLYRTNGDPHLGLFANVLSLYGFWRTGPGPELPKDVIIGWPFIMFAILVIVGVGAWYAFRGRPIVDKSANLAIVGKGQQVESKVSRTRTTNVNHSSEIDQKSLASLLVFFGVMGYFLALGNQGPSGWLFVWAYKHLPFFSIMREPQKFLMLLALAYAVFFGWGVERLSQVNVSTTRFGAVTAAMFLGVALPLGYCSTIFDGLAGQISSSPLPQAYQYADALMGTGAGNVLVLPWHIYMEYPLSHGRVITNVGPTAFRRNVISGDNVEADNVETQSTSPRSSYLENLFQEGNMTSSFGALITPLGVRFVVLSKAVDWVSYSWLNDQKDLTLVLDDRSLEVWRNLAYDGVGQRVAKLSSVTDIAGLLALAKENELGDGAVVMAKSTNTSFSATTPRASALANVSTTRMSVRQLSPVAYQISKGSPGWVTVDATYQKGWSLNGHAAKKSAEGTVLVRVGAKGGELVFTPWRLVRLGYIISISTFASLVLILIAESQRRKRIRDRVRGSDGLIESA